jgi:PBS lyase HEAT-like repeat
MKPIRPAAQVTSVLLFLALTAIGQDEISSLLARLDEDQLDPSALGAIEAHTPDPRILPALEEAFARHNAKEEKQEIAVTLIRLGNKSATYFDFLAGFARAAVEDRTPYFIAFDRNGKEIRGQLSAEFENFCQLNGLDPKATAAKQFGDYIQDVHFLARAQDPRATEIFHRGLESPYPNVVGYSVEGLGRLQDTAAIPLIEKACERLKGAQGVVAMALPWYGTPEAEALMERLMPDPKHREFEIQQVQRLRLIELRQALSRAGVVNQK